MNVRAAKVGVWFYMLFTLASFATTIIFYITTTGMGTIAIAGLPLWMAYTVFSVIKSIADLIGPQQRIANFTRMLDRWEDTFESRGKALLLLFFILAAQFESLVQPWIILSEIVIDLFGALVVLWAFGQTLNLMSMIGLIVVCGIVINDSILKIDTINTLRRQGMGLKHAIMEAGRRRLKAIVMTSLTTILAVAPFLSHGDMGSDLQLPMSLTIISGMIVGTLVSVFFIPLAYYEIYRPRR